ncbi:TPM domain-containing protein [Methylocystis sp. JR02]|uniref:TPM domain-containing protein n=1 Tax=Methylocystis sp. JR02 TaxID=3046284 RepID=UPI0024B88CFE|nr:TPM domain-containing protein [Methylocystis sp. JR02]MDJ0449177.1 TPM domain-containing protein [Methylocystis sp. JR02]
MNAPAFAPRILAPRTLALRGCLVFVFCLLAALAFAAPNYPALTGRIVDQAGVIPEATRASLQTKLKDLEDKSSIQLVVATIKTLDGYDIETYANGLFRAWKLGEAKKNNGVLFLVAPSERKMRIEVGYGLEGTLTDALSKVILASAVAPKFKAGDYGAGIERGVEGIIEILSGDSAEWVKKAPPPPSMVDELLPLLIFALFVFIFIMMARSAGRPKDYRHYRRGGPPIVILPPSRGDWGDGGSFGGGSSWGGGDGGGFDSFSGGGGSSGGGGASGDW